MNEYWQADDFASFCFCYGGEWYHLLETEGEWDLCPVTMDRGLPTEMHENFYHEVDLPTMLRAAAWSEAHLHAQTQNFSERVNDV